VMEGYVNGYICSWIHVHTCIVILSQVREQNICSQQKKTTLLPPHCL
jgi:hypothetical protein